MLRFEAIVEEVIAAPMPCGAHVVRREVMNVSRRLENVQARVLICVLAFKYMHKPSSPKIGRLIDRDHSTVLHAVCCFKRDFAVYEKVYQILCRRLSAKVQQKAARRQLAILSLEEVAA